MRARSPVDTKDSSTNRTMLRGLSLLRAFRPGFPVLTNRDLAESTGLARSTVSRLTGALLTSGLLRQLPGTEGYAPTAACISLGFAALQSLSGLRERVLPVMEEAADAQQVSVSLAIPDGDEMIYIDTYRKARGETLQKIAPGARIPMELTALGHGALSVMPADERHACVTRLASKHAKRAEQIVEQIALNVTHCAAHGWCRASWFPGLVSVARPMVLPGGLILVFNCAGSVEQMNEAKIRDVLLPLLFQLTELAAQADGPPPR